MDRNLTERLKKLSEALADAVHRRNTLSSNGFPLPGHEEELDKAAELVDPLQDEIWDIEDQIQEQEEIEYEDHSGKGWN